MALDLTKIEEHKVKAGVQGKMFFIYGGPKTGKTTIACSFSKPLLLAFEAGYNLIDGIKAVNVTSWVDMKNYAKQLKKELKQELKLQHQKLHQQLIIYYSNRRY